MELTIIIEQRFVRTPDGTTWTSALFPREHWERYLTVFDAVRVVARVEELSTVPESYRRVDGEQIRVDAVPYYVGPLGYLRRWHSVRAALAAIVETSEAVISRAPSQVATTAMPLLRRDGRPYGIEVIGDPYDAFAPGAVRHPLRPFFRWWYTRAQQCQVRDAAVATYVTQKYLQQRYAANLDARAFARSDVDLGEEAYVDAPREPRERHEPTELVTIGSFELYYKRIDIVIEAVAHCMSAGEDVRLRIVGDGRHRPDLEALANRVGVRDRVTFVGQVPQGAAVRAELDQAELYVMASRQEGLPRAMVEAMARGLPCIGTAVGGIPELLAPDCLVTPNDADALARKIQCVLRDPARMAHLSTMNLERARAYRDGVLREHQRAFLEAVPACLPPNGSSRRPDADPTARLAAQYWAS